MEAGAGTTLTGLGRHCLPASRWLSGQGEGGRTEQVHGLLTALGSLYRRGAELDWHRITGRAGRVPLPGHPLRRVPVTPGAGRTPERAPAPETGAAAPDELLDDIVELTAAKLGLRAADVAPDSSFFALGADSLSLMGMTAELEQRHGARVPVRELFESVDTPRRLAERLVVLRGETPEPQAAGPKEHTGTVEPVTAAQPSEAVASSEERQFGSRRAPRSPRPVRAATQADGEAFRAGVRGDLPPARHAHARVGDNGRHRPDPGAHAGPGPHARPGPRARPGPDPATGADAAPARLAGAQRARPGLRHRMRTQSLLLR